jgi:hypothetical protein
MFLTILTANISILKIGLSMEAFERVWLKVDFPIIDTTQTFSSLSFRNLYRVEEEKTMKISSLRQ